MSDDRDQTGEEPRTVLDQEQEVLSLEVVMQKNFPRKNHAEVEEAIGNAKRAVTSSDSRDKLEELFRNKLHGRDSSQTGAPPRCFIGANLS